MKTDNIQHIIKWCWIWLAVISAQQAATALETVVECHMLPYGVLGIPLNYCVDVSGDGSRVLVVVPGWENMAMPRRVLVWEEGQITELDGFTDAYSISADGKVVVGVSYTDGEGTQALQWRDGETAGLPELPDTESSLATVVSTDGSTIGGICFVTDFDGTIPKTVIWRNGEVIPLDGVNLIPLSLSGDGNIIGGISSIEPSYDGYAYNIQNDEVYLFEDGGGAFMVPLDISSNGAWFAGIAGNYMMWWTGNPYYGAEWWEWDSETVIYPETPEWGDTFAAEGVCQDGSIIIGSLKPDQPFDDLIIWTRQPNHDYSAARLGQILADNEIALADEGTYRLVRLYENPLTGETFENLPYTVPPFIGGPAISDDGSTIVGTYRISGETGGSLAGFVFRSYNKWGPYKVTASCVSTHEWMGLLNVEFAPWVWCNQTACWYYIREAVADAKCGWIYCPDLMTDSPGLWLVMLPGSNWGWSYGLGNWLYVAPGSLDNGAGWIYMMGDYDP